MFLDRPNISSLLFVVKFAAQSLPVGLLILTCALPLHSVHTRKHPQWGAELSVDMDAPYEQIVKIAQAVCEDGVIRGTWQYKGTHELDGATASPTAAGFEPWKGQGVVLYKVQPNALAPEHFYETGDQGAVAVRYIVEPGGANLTHLHIAAIFATNSGRRVHPSDGAVEDAEFSEISQRLQDLQDQERKEKEAVTAQQQEGKADELRAELQRDRAQLEAMIARQRQLEREVKNLKKGQPARIRTESADLKAAPYNESKTVRLLALNEVVTVVEQTQHWYRIQTGTGDQGWVYRLMVEVSR